MTTAHLSIGYDISAEQNEGQEERDYCCLSFLEGVRIGPHGYPHSHP